MSSTSDSAALEIAGRSAFPDFTLRRLARTRSTQEVVRRAARAGALEGFCCVADEQTAGRGRHGRAWVAPAGSALLCSTLLRVPAERLAWISLAGGLAVLDALAGVEETRHVRALLKWPNDVVVDGAKLAGVLCEVEPTAPGSRVAVAAGVGLNVRVPAFPEGAHGVSLHQLVATPPTWQRLLAELLTALCHRRSALVRGDVAALRSDWRCHATGLGQVVRVHRGEQVLTGVAEDVDDDGALLLRTVDGIERLIAGDVHIGNQPAH